MCKNFFGLVETLFEDEIQSTKTILPMQDVKKNEQLMNKFIYAEGETIREYFSFWLNVPVPLFILRMEDIIYNPEDTLRRLFSFLLGVENIKGSLIENRLITFLKYNKPYTAFLEESLNQEDPAKHFTNFQKTLVVKIFQEELGKLGYINSKNYLQLSLKRELTSEDFEALTSLDENEESWYEDNNKKAIKQSQDMQNRNDLYVVSSFLKLNNRESLRDKY